MTKQEQADKLIDAIYQVAQVVNEVEVDRKTRQLLYPALGGLRHVRDRLIEEMDKERKA